MVHSWKSDKKRARLVVDYSYLNKFIERPVHPFPTTGDVIRMVPGGSLWFAAFDLQDGYHAIPLGPKSSQMSAFLVDGGRYQFTKAVQGVQFVALGMFFALELMRRCKMCPTKRKLWMICCCGAELRRSC